MGAFIAKTRWDLMVKGEDRKALIEMAAAPGVKERLHKIILCGRRYIQQCCENIGNGNVMIRRLLMSTGYTYDCPSVFLIYVEAKKEASYLIFCKRNQVETNMGLCWVV